MSDDLRDGPTVEFIQHHDVVHRGTGIGGKRVRSRLEQMLTGGIITPEQCDAGRRFRDDYLIGIVGRTRSCLDISVRSANDSVAETRHDAAGRFEAARAHLDVRKSPLATHGRPSEIVLACVVFDESFSGIGRKLGDGDAAAKRFLAQQFITLETHYAEADRRGGRSTTPHTMAGIMSHFEPDGRPA